MESNRREKGKERREDELEKHERGNKHEMHGKIYFFEISSNFFQRDQSGASIEIQQDGGSNFLFELLVSSAVFSFFISE